MQKIRMKIPTEAEEQERLFRWAEIQKYNDSRIGLLKSDLSGVRLSIGQAVKAKKQGMKKGYPDIFLPVSSKGFHGLFIELKREKGGILSDEQKTWLKQLVNQGYLAIVCKGSDEAINAIIDYLSNG